MRTIALLLTTSTSNELANRFNEGGPFFMSLILICLVLALTFMTIGFIHLTKNSAKVNRMIILTSEISILGLVIGFLGSIIGMIQAFDTIEALENINHANLAAGLKISFLTALFGSITFIVPRIGIILIKGLQKL